MPAPNGIPRGKIFLKGIFSFAVDETLNLPLDPSTPPIYGTSSTAADEVALLKWGERRERTTQDEWNNARHVKS